MSQPKPLFYLAAIGIFLFASIGQAQTTPVAVIQTPIQIDANRVAFSPDGKWVVTVDQDGRDHTLWDVKTGRKVAELPAGGTSRGPSGPDIVFSPDGRYLASFDASQMAVPTIVWDLETYEAASLGKLDAPNQVRSSIAKWTPAEVRGWPHSGGGTIPAFLAGANGERGISTIAISLNGENLAAGRVNYDEARDASQTALIDAWSLHGGKPPYTFAKGLYSLQSLAFSHNSEWLGAASQTGSTTGRYTAILVGGIHLWHVADHAETKLEAESKWVKAGDEPSATNVAFSPDNKQLVADVFTSGEIPDRDCRPDELCGDPESVPYNVRTTFFDVASGHAANSTPLGKGDSSDIEHRRSFWLSPDGRRAFAWLREKFVPVNTLTGRRLNTFKAPEFGPDPGPDDCVPGVHALGFAAFSSDVQRVAISGGEQLQILDARTGASTHEPLMVADDPNEHWRTLAGVFSPSGGTLAVSFCESFWGSGQVRLYNTSKLQVFSVSPSDHVSTSLAFTPDGALLFTGGYDGAVRVLETQHGLLVATLVRNTEGKWIVFTPDGLYDASADGASLLAWRLKGQIVLASELPELRLPGLLSKLVSGERPKPAKPLASAMSAALQHSNR